MSYIVKICHVKKLSNWLINLPFYTHDSEWLHCHLKQPDILLHVFTVCIVDQRSRRYTRTKSLPYWLYKHRFIIIVVYENISCVKIKHVKLCLFLYYQAGCTLRLSSPCLYLCGKYSLPWKLVLNIACLACHENLF